MVKQTIEVYLAPTPPVGCPVHYLAHGAFEEPLAATVVRIEAVGQLTLAAFKPNRLPEFKRGVLHRKHPRVVGNGKFNGEMSRNGCWDFICAELTPRGAHELARRQLKQQEEQEQRAAADRGGNHRMTAPWNGENTLISDEKSLHQLFAIHE